MNATHTVPGVTTKATESQMMHTGKFNLTV